METVLELPGTDAAFSQLFAAQPESRASQVGGWPKMVSVAGATGMDFSACGLPYLPGLSYTETCPRLSGPNGVRLQSA